MSKRASWGRRSWPYEDNDTIFLGYSGYILSAIFNVHLGYLYVVFGLYYGFLSFGIEQYQIGSTVSEAFKFVVKETIFLGEMWILKIYQGIFE